MTAEYIYLFNAITDIIEQLQEMQKRAEELYLERGD